MADNTSNSSTSKSTTDEEKEEQERKNKALRQLYEMESENFEKTSNAILQGVREKGVSVNDTNDKKKLPEQISDIHILFSRQKPEFVFEGVDTSEELEKELENADDDEDDSSD